MNEPKKVVLAIYIWHFSKYGPHIIVCIHFGMPKFGKQSSLFSSKFNLQNLLPPIFLLYGTCMWITGAKCLCDQTFCLAYMPRV